MPKVFYGDMAIEIEAGETVLQALLRSGIDAAFSCETGSCQTCMLQADDSDLPVESQVSLVGKLRTQGYFLPCVCKPKDDITVIDVELNSLYQPLKILEKYRYNRSICRLRFLKPVGFEYRAGQFINLRSPDHSSIIRSYSLCSHPHEDDFLEIQVHHKTNGNLSGVLCEALQVGDSIDMQGPNGHCYYRSEPQRPMLLIATNTGIAPLYGIVRSALREQHQAGIHIYYGSRKHEGLYLLDDLEVLVAAHSQLTLRATLSGEAHEIIGAGEHLQAGRAHEHAFVDHNKVLAEYDLYLCGNSGMVKAAQMQGFLAGIPMQRIFTDPFEHKDLRTAKRS